MAEVRLASRGSSPPIGNGSALGTIHHADRLPSFTINDTSISETGVLASTVTKNGATSLSSVQIATSLRAIRGT